MAESEKKSAAASFEYQSEVQQLLHILVYSLYKNKDVFLRELLSNATDALNKVQFELLANPEGEDKDLELKIAISFDKKNGTLIVEDTGSGMTREELIQNIGTIAHSGTLDFLKRIAASPRKDSVDLIGKFGVGFYSSFMVAKEIHIHTKSYQKGSRAILWKSAGENTYTIEDSDQATRGTRIELFLKKEDKIYLEAQRIKTVILKHSKFVPFPIYVDSEKIARVEAIWTQPKSQLSEKEYNDFYKFLENTPEEPETHLHLSSDAPVQFTALLYIPKTSLELRGIFKSEPGVDLYSKKILIQKASQDLLPEYLRFVKGVVDSEDIPLNISRETIQSNRTIDKIRKHILKKLLEHLEQLKEKEHDKFMAIWKNFSRHFKEGIMADYENRDKLAPLLFFHSSQTAKGEWIDLKTYVQRMPKEQNEIYYASGSDSESIRRNPALEAFGRKKWEVLYLLDPLDELAVEHLGTYEKRSFKLAEKADIQLEREKKEQDQEYLKKVDLFLSYLKTIYGEHIAAVRISRRLVDSPCLLAPLADAPSVQIEKIMKMVDQHYQFSKGILEINPDHPLIQRMVEAHQKAPDAPRLRNLALQLLDNMLLREGVLQDMEATVARIQEIMLEAASSG